MQAEVLSPEKALTDAQRALLEALRSPFDPGEVEWRITATSNNERGKSGFVMPYADPRAYSDRLNQVVTAAGWTRSFSIATIAPLVRQKKENGKSISVQTGKIVVTCTITISSLGTHSSTGESWADDDNAMTSAEAQSFKRACACFGLGRYFYDYPGAWVALDEKNRIREKPSLPKWALPKVAGQGQAAVTAKTGAAASTSGSGQNEWRDPNKGAPSTSSGQRAQTGASRTAPARSGSEQADSVWIDKWIERFAERLGRKLYLDTLSLTRNEAKKAELSPAQTREKAIDMLEMAERGLQKIEQFAEQVGEEAFGAVLHKHEIPSMLGFPDLKAVIDVHKALASLVFQTAGASRRAA